MKLKIIIILGLFLFSFNPIINAADIDNYFFQTSLYTLHYSDKNYQNNKQNLLSFERHYKDQSLNGIAFFKNTYGQNTIFIYHGKNYHLSSIGNFNLTAKLTYGIVSGYDDEDGKYKTWMHEMETFPALVFGVGIQKKPYRLDIIPFADAGIIVTGGVEF